MSRPSESTIAQVCIGVLLLVIIRSLGEFFRLQYLHGDALVVGQVAPYVAGALFAAVALALAGACYLGALYRTSIAIAVATVVSLFVYKLTVVG
jgi:hypothetical protein